MHPRLNQISSYNFPHDVSVNVGQAKIAAGIMKGELFVIETEQREQRGVQIVNVDGFFRGFEPEFIGGAMNGAALYAATGKPHRESVMVVVAAVLDVGVGGARCGDLDGRSASEFAAPNNQRVLKQTPLLEIPEKRANGLIAFARETAMICSDLLVTVPWLAFPMPDLHEAYAALD
jgi:hypothetical protein